MIELVRYEAGHQEFLRFYPLTQDALRDSDRRTGDLSVGSISIFKKKSDVLESTLKNSSMFARRLASTLAAVNIHLSGRVIEGCSA